MKTQYYTATSIDGFIADADNSLEWLFTVGSSGRGGTMKDEYPNFMAEVGAMAMGSTTYEWIAAHTGFLDDPSKWEYSVPTWVFSSRDLPVPDGLGYPPGLAATYARCMRRWPRRPAGRTSGWSAAGSWSDSSTTPACWTS